MSPRVRSHFTGTIQRLAITQAHRVAATAPTMRLSPGLLLRAAPPVKETVEFVVEPPEPEPEPEPKPVPLLCPLPPDVPFAFGTTGIEAEGIGGGTGMVVTDDKDGLQFMKRTCQRRLEYESSQTLKLDGSRRYETYPLLPAPFPAGPTILPEIGGGKLVTLTVTLGSGTGTSVVEGIGTSEGVDGIETVNDIDGIGGDGTMTVGAGGVEGTTPPFGIGTVGGVGIGFITGKLTEPPESLPPMGPPTH